MKKFTAIMPIVALLLGVAAPSVQAAPSNPDNSAMCQNLPKSEPWKNHPTHVWNVVWRNKVALCGTQAKLEQLQSAKAPASQQANQPTAPATPIAESIQLLPQNP